MKRKIVSVGSHGLRSCFGNQWKKRSRSREVISRNTACVFLFLGHNKTNYLTLWFQRQSYLSTVKVWCVRLRDAIVHATVNRRIWVLFRSRCLFSARNRVESVFKLYFTTDLRFLCHLWVLYFVTRTNLEIVILLCSSTLDYRVQS